MGFWFQLSRQSSFAPSACFAKFFSWRWWPSACGGRLRSLSTLAADTGNRRQIVVTSIRSRGVSDSCRHHWRHDGTYRSTLVFTSVDRPKVASGLTVPALFRCRSVSVPPSVLAGATRPPQCDLSNMNTSMNMKDASPFPCENKTSRIIRSIREESSQAPSTNTPKIAQNSRKTT